MVAARLGWSGAWGLHGCLYPHPVSWPTRLHTDICLSPLVLSGPLWLFSAMDQLGLPSSVVPVQQWNRCHEAWAAARGFLQRRQRLCALLGPSLGIHRVSLPQSTCQKTAWVQGEGTKALSVTESKVKALGAVFELCHHEKNMALEGLDPQTSLHSLGASDSPVMAFLAVGRAGSCNATTEGVSMVAGTRHALPFLLPDLGGGLTEPLWD